MDSKFIEIKFKNLCMKLKLLIYLVLEEKSKILVLWHNKHWLALILVKHFFRSVSNKIYETAEYQLQSIHKLPHISSSLKWMMNILQEQPESHTRREFIFFDVEQNFRIRYLLFFGFLQKFHYDSQCIWEK